MLVSVGLRVPASAIASSNKDVGDYSSRSLPPGNRCPLRPGRRPRPDLPSGVHRSALLKLAH